MSTSVDLGHAPQVLPKNDSVAEPNVGLVEETAGGPELLSKWESLQVLALEIFKRLVLYTLCLESSQVWPRRGAT